jgi:DNA-binding winged helix-turn-helix (wHTH) protein
MFREDLRPSDLDLERGTPWPADPQGAVADGIYAFGSCELDSERRVLLVDGRSPPLTSRSFDLLLFLVRHGPRVLTRKELLHHLWPRTHVEEGNLSVNICAVRRALRDDARNPRYIVTVARHGYRLITAVNFRPAQAAGSSASAPPGCCARWQTCGAFAELRPRLPARPAATAPARAVAEVEETCGGSSHC